MPRTIALLCIATSETLSDYGSNYSNTCNLWPQNNQIARFNFPHAHIPLVFKHGWTDSKSDPDMTVIIYQSYSVVQHYKTVIVSR